MRRTEALRALVRETALAPDDLVWPLFAVPGQRVRNAVKSMPGVFQLSVDELVAEAQAGYEAGVRSVILFGVPEKKDATGSEAWAEDGDHPARGAGAEADGSRPGGDDRRLHVRVHRPRPLRRPEAGQGRARPAQELAVDNDLTLPLLASEAVAHARAGRRRRGPVAT